MAVAINHVTIALMLLLISTPSHAQTTPATQASCGDIDRLMTPCIPFLADRALHPVPLCCLGAIAARRMAAVTDEDRKAVCECLKSLGSQFVGLDPARAARLPALCGIHMSSPISASVNCSNIPPVVMN